MPKQVIRYNLIFAFLFLFTSNVFAADVNNELVKMDFNQSSDGSVKVNIYTDKPYKDQIIVNKKPDNKYVILLPETVNSLGVKPDVSGISGVQNVDVKTQQYSSLPGKGYTKITIDTKRPINLVPQAYVTKKLVPEKKTKSRPYVSPQQVQMTVPQRVLQQRALTNNDFSSAYERRERVQASQPSYVARPQQAQSNIRREARTQQYVQPQRQVEQPVVQQTTTQQTQVQQVVETVATQENASAIDNAQENTTEKLENQQAVDDESISAIDDDISESELAFFKKIIRVKQKVVNKVKKLLSVRISFASFMTVLQFILLIVLIKIIGDLIKKVQDTGSSQSPSVTRRLIHDNDETFEPAYPSYSNMDVYNTNRSNFEEDNKEGFNVKPLSTPMNFSNVQPKVQNNLYSKSNFNQPQPFSAQSDFYKPLSKISEEEKMSIFDENANEIEKRIFKNPLTSISKQDEETLFDDNDLTEENSPFNSDKYSINERDEFFNYSNASDNDEDFFIFEDEDEDEDVEYQEDYIDEEEDEEYEYVEEDDEDYDNVDEYEEDEIDNEVSEEPQKEVDPFEHLTVHSKYVIDANRGFAQVSVDGINALIGYVGSKISVIRKFQDEVKGSMQVRLNEQPDAQTMIYILKLGSYKTLVEVKTDNIRPLLDL